MVDFDPFSRDFFDDPYETYRQLRHESPCFHSERWDFYAFSRFEDLVRLHRDPERFTSTHGLTYEQLSDPNHDDSLNSLIMMDPPEHTRYRKLVSRSFTPRAMAGYEDMIRSLMAEYLDPLMDRDEFDLVGEFSAPFPVEIICAILGIDDREQRQRIRHLADITLTREEGQSTGGDAARDAQIEQGMLFYEYVQHRRAHPSDDMCTALIEATVETEDGDTKALDDAEIAGFCSLLGAAGSETVTKAVANAAVLFHRNPDQWQEVKDDPTKIPAAVEEVVSTDVVVA